LAGHDDKSVLLWMNGEIYAVLLCGPGRHLDAISDLQRRYALPDKFGLTPVVAGLRLIGKHLVEGVGLLDQNVTLLNGLVQQNGL